jgi:hypothetical protein
MALMPDNKRRIEIFQEKSPASPGFAFAAEIEKACKIWRINHKSGKVYPV